MKQLIFSLLLIGFHLNTTEAYSALYLAEAAAIRDIVQAAYEHPAPLSQKAAAVAAWGEANDRFQPQAAELIELLSVLKSAER